MLCFYRGCTIHYSDILVAMYWVMHFSRDARVLQGTMQKYVMRRVPLLTAVAVG